MKKKKLSLLLCVALVMSLFAGLGITAAASGNGAILIASNGAVTYNGGDAGTYSGGNYYAINKPGEFGDAVSSITTSDGVSNAGTSITFTGVRGIDNGESTLKITSMPDGINIANSGWIGAINQQSSSNTSGTSNLDVTGIGNINVKSTGTGYGAKGIGAYGAKNTDITKNTINVGASSLTVEAAGTAYGIQGTLAGRTTTVNIPGAVVIKGVGDSGKAYITNLTDAAPVGKATLNFGSVNASSESSLAYGFHAAGGVAADITLDGDMTVTGETYGIGFRLAGNSDVKLKSKDSKKHDITVSSNSNYSMGADVGNGSSSTAKLDLDMDKFTVTSASAEAYGLYAEASASATITGSINELSVAGGTDVYAIYTEGGSVSGTFGTISAASTGGSAYAVYATGGGTVTVNDAVTLTGDVNAEAGAVVTLKNAAVTGNITVGSNAVLNLKNTTISAGSVTNAGTITVDMTDATEPVVKLIDYTGTGTMTLDDYGTVTLTGNDNYIAMVIGNDFYAVTKAAADKTTIVVNGDWSGKEPGEEITIGDKTYYYCINTFSNMAAAIDAAQTGSMIEMLSADCLTDESPKNETTEGTSGYKYNNAIFIDKSVTVKNADIEESFAAENTGNRVRGIYVNGEDTDVAFVTETGKMTSISFDRDKTRTRSQTGWSYGISLGNGSDNAVMTFNGKGDLAISGNQQGGGDASSPYGWSLNGIRVNGKDNKLTFANEGKTTITESSMYGVNGVVNYGTTKFTDGTVLINTYLDGGVGFSNNVAMFNCYGNIDVTSDVDEMTIFTEGAAYFAQPESGDISDGAAAIYNASYDGGATAINAKKLNVLAVSGEDTNKKWTIGGTEITGHTTYSEDKATAVGEGKYSTTFGIKNEGMDSITVGADTVTNIYTRDFHKNSVAVCAVAYEDSGYMETNGSISILGNTNITAEGDTGTYALYTVDGNAITIGSQGKTVNITGDIYAAGSGITTGEEGTAKASTISLQGTTNTVTGNVTVGVDAVVNLANTTVTGNVTVGSNAALHFKNTTISAGSVTNAGTITVDMTDATEPVVKLIDYTGTGTMTLDDYGTVTLTGNDNYIAMVIGNDFYAVNKAIDKTTLAVNEDWSGKDPGEEITIGDKTYYYGINAFSQMAAAIGAVTNAPVNIYVLEGNVGTEETNEGEGTEFTVAGTYNISGTEWANLGYLQVNPEKTVSETRYVLNIGTSGNGAKLVAAKPQLRVSSDLNITDSHLDFTNQSGAVGGYLYVFKDSSVTVKNSVLGYDAATGNSSNVTAGAVSTANAGQMKAYISGTFTADNSTVFTTGGDTKDNAFAIYDRGYASFKDSVLYTNYITIGDYEEGRSDRGTLGRDGEIADLTLDGSGIYANSGELYGLIVGDDKAGELILKNESVIEFSDINMTVNTNGNVQIDSTSQIKVKKLTNAGTITVDMTGATKGVIKLIDATDTSDYGTYQFATSKDNGYILRVIDNNLYAFKTFAVSFDARGGSAVSGMTAACEDTVAKPADPEKAGYTFGGWYIDEACTDAWNFDNDKVMEDVTLYAKWIQNTVVKAAVSGTVTDSDGTNPISGAVVELWLGTEKVAAANTDSLGAYNFNNVENGLYNIVVTAAEKTKTATVNVNRADTFTVAPVKMPAANVSSKVEVKDDSSAETEVKADVASTVVSGVDAVAEGETPGTDDTITIVLTVEPKAEDSANAEQTAIKQEAGNKTLEFVEFTLTKQVNSEDPTDIGSSNNKLLEITLPFDTTGIDISSITVYRYHGSTATALTRITDVKDKADGTFMVGENEITIFASQFSTYAIGYDKIYGVNAADAQNGSITVSPETAAVGSTVTVTVTPEEGYTLETITVTDENGEDVPLTTVEEGKTYTFTMPETAVTAGATFMEDNTMLNFFVDVKADDYFYDAVLWAVENEITNGVDSTHFAPLDITTRAQMVTFLWRLAGCPEPTITSCAFTDVKAGAYYYKAVLWAVENGVTLGTSATTFSPNVTTTRCQALAFLWRYSEKPAAAAENPFTDVKVTAYYYDAVLWAVENGITKGTGAAKFTPNAGCTRCQVITFLYRSVLK